MITVIVWFGVATVGAVALGTYLRGHLDAVSIDAPTVAVRTCRPCGCTDAAACPGGCAWVEVDLCSACAEWADAADRMAAERGHPSARQLPGRSDPRAHRSWATVGWLLTGAFMIAALGWTGTHDFIAAGGIR